MDQSASQVKSCLDEALNRPGGPTTTDLANAMKLFVGECYLRHVEITMNSNSRLQKLSDALYGPEGEPEKGLLDLKRSICRVLKVMTWVGAIVGSAIVWLLKEIAGKLI